MLKTLDFTSIGAAEILTKAKADPLGYGQLYKDRDSETRLIVDHAVPISVMVGMLFNQDGARVDLSRESVEAHLSKWYRLGLISHGENSWLNNRKLGSKMPADWDGVDPFARYCAVGIRAQTLDSV